MGSTKIHFCTLFDKHYLNKGLALCQSLNKNCPNFTLYILCLDNVTYKTLKELNLNNAILLELSDLEKDDTALLNCKNNRSLIEYYFTLSPCLPLYILEKLNPTIDFICSLDADLFFYDDPSVIFKDFDNYSILITAHHFHKELESLNLEKYGLFNVSFQAFKNDAIGIACLEKWRKQCLEWCYDTLDTENNRFADQLYLNNWQNDFPQKVKIIYPNTEGVAPWNINRFHLTIHNEKIYSNGKPLIFYHFHGVHFITPYLVTNKFFEYKILSNSIIKKNLYLPYIKLLKEINNNLESSFNHQKSIRYKQTFKIFTVINQNTVFLFNKNIFLLLRFSVITHIFNNIRTQLSKTIKGGLSR